MPAANTPIQSPPAKVLLADAAQPDNVPGRWLLVVFGTLLVGLFIAGLVITRIPGSETTATPAPSTSATAGASSSSSATSKPSASTSAASSSKTTTKAVPTEGELLALLGTGGVLVLTGALYSRINAIKLPGGAEIDLSPEEKSAVAKEVATQAAQTAQTTGASHQQLAQSTADALDTALESARLMKLRAGGKLDQAAIQQSARVGLQIVAEPVGQSEIAES